MHPMFMNLGGLKVVTPATPADAMGLLRRERGLWPFAAAPIALTVTLLAIALGLLTEFAGPLYALATEWMPTHSHSIQPSARRRSRGSG